MGLRELKARQIVATGRITRGADCYHVPSQTGVARYRVVLDGLFQSCTCPDFDLIGPRPCKHILAVRELQDAGQHIPADGPPEPPQVVLPKASGRQQWRAYTRAQTTEKHRFQVLLADLCRGIEEPPPAKTGRPRVPLADAVFSVAFKVYSTVSSRRFNCDLQDAHDAGHLSRPIHHNKVNEFMENPGLGAILTRLIGESAAPLAAVECDFAADSSAFTSHRFARWYDAKYSTERKYHDWVKVQMMCGVKTNIVTSAVICDQDGPDSPYLPALVNQTAERFTVERVMADKGYSSTYGHEAVAAVGATPFIAFKKNATGNSGGVYQKMFHYFQYRREEFLAAYHRRSNAESVFSSVKAKFGDAVRSKTRPAMGNEVLCKLLAHNICVLIQEQEELGISPLFFADDAPDEPADDSPAIIRFPGV